MKDLTLIKLSTQKALLGSITENMRAISVGISEKTLLLRAYFFKKPSNIEIELLSTITTEILADFNEINSVEEEFFTNNNLECLDFWAFMRFEVN